MTPTLIANIALASTALFALLFMLRHDTAMLRLNEYDNKRFYGWLREGDELLSPKRLTALAVLIACCTTMAKQSWMVVILLAVALLALGALMAAKRQAASLQGDRRAARRYVLAVLLALASVAAATVIGKQWFEADFSGSWSAAILSVIELALSPVIAMLTNTLISPFEKTHLSP